MLGKVPGCPLSREWRLLVLSRERLVVFSRGSRTLAFPREQRSSGSRGLERLMHWWHRLPLNVVYAALTVGYMLAASRSEEHTSELQSLMRISSAVFCLKKKILLHRYHCTGCTMMTL